MEELEPEDDADKDYVKESSEESEEYESEPSSPKKPSSKVKEKVMEKPKNSSKTDNKIQVSVENLPGRGKILQLLKRLERNQKVCISTYDFNLYLNL